MATYLVSLVSEQTIPNVQIIREFPPFDKYVFVTTEKTAKEGQADWIAKVCQLPAEHCIRKKVIEDSLADIFNRMDELKLAAGDEVTVNLTGGTKIMALGVFQYFTQKHPANSIVYIPIGANAYKVLFPPGAGEEKIPLVLRLDLPAYLASYGIEITAASKDDALEQPLNTTRLFFQKYPFGKTPLPALRQWKDEQYKRGNRQAALNLSNPPAVLAGLESWLQTTGFRQRQGGWLTDAEVQWLIGGWFEEYVYMLCRVWLSLPEEAIGTSMMIKRREVLNECDVIFTHNNTLHLIECKTSLNKERFEQTVYKIGAIRRDFGLQVRAYLFTAAPAFRKGGQVEAHIANRLSLMNIRLVDDAILRSETALSTFFNSL
jgi:hypothetical protein